jgi:hypothetical protein
MMSKTVFALLLGAGLAFCFLGVPAIEAATVTHIGTSADQTDYSPAGLNLGTAGYWFPNFAAASPVTGAAVDSNHRNTLPSWFTPDFNPLNVGTYSFDPTAATTGGQPNYDVLTLPNGETGISGQLVDVGHPNSANNTIPRIVLGPGVPSTFYVHIVADNDNGEHALNRIRARGNADTQSNATVEPPALLAFNQTADVYTFRYDGYVNGNTFALQLRGALVDTVGLTGGIGGIMLDLVPEPTSALLLTLGAMSLSVAAGRRRR